MSGTARQSSGLLALTAAMAVFVAAGYAITVVLARLLGPAEFGRYGVVVAVVTVLQIAVTRGVPAAASAEIAARGGDRRVVQRPAWLLTLAVSLVIALVVAAFAPFAARALHDPALRMPFTIGGLAAASFGVQALLLGQLNGEHRFRHQAVVDVVHSIARLALIIAGAEIDGVRGAIAGFVLAPAIAAVASLSRGAHGPDLPLPIELTARELARRATPLAATAVAISLLLVGDLVAFKRVATAADVGIYNAAETIAQVPFFLLNAAVLVLLPSVAALASSHADHRLATIRRGFADAWVVLALPAAVIIALGDAALPLIFGSRFDVDDTIVVPLALATIGITLHSLLVAIEGGLGRLREALGLGALGIVVMVVAVVRSGSGSDLQGASWAVAIVGLTIALVHLVLLRVRVGNFLDMRRVLGCSLIAIALAAATTLVPQTLPWMLAAGLAATGLYAAICLRLSLFTLGAARQQ